MLLWVGFLFTSLGLGLLGGSVEHSYGAPEWVATLLHYLSGVMMGVTVMLQRRSPAAL